MKIPVFKNRKGEISFISLGDYARKKVVINIKGNIVEADIKVIPEDEEEYLIKEEEMPECLKSYVEKYKEEILGLEKFDLKEMKILYSYVFDGKTHKEISELSFGVKPTGTHDGWIAGEYLRSRGAVDDFSNRGSILINDYKLDKNEYVRLPPKIKLLVRLVRYGILA